MRSAIVSAFVWIVFLPVVAECDDGLIAHWPLAENGQDVSGNGLHATAQAVNFAGTGPSDVRKTAALFDGQNAVLEVPANEHLRLG